MKFCIALLLVFFCSPLFAERPAVVLPADTQTIPEPEYDDLGDYIWSDGAYYMSIYQMEKLIDLSWWAQKLHLMPKERAANTTPLDQVRNSSWFSNRHAQKRLSVEELTNGPVREHLPGKNWTVVRGKGLGINPGFVAKDEHGQLLFVKFDPKKFVSMGINADMIVSRILYAAGYNVPEYFSVRMDPKNITLSPKATINGKYKRKRPMTQSDLNKIFLNAPKDDRGFLIANVSKSLPGKPKGPFNFMGRRKDDPNDTVRHEDRRELRGLRVIMSWLNNTDARRGNSLDMYVQENGRSFVKHYLLDFSASFGSGNIHPKEAYEGHQYFIDPAIISKSLGALGVWVKPWEISKIKVYPEIGRFTADPFHPEKWRTSYANPAFEKMTPRDAFWGAKIVVSFTDQDIRAIADQGDFYTTGAKEHLVVTLIKRRDDIGRYWMDTKRINPIDNFVIEKKEKTMLKFENLAQTQGYVHQNSIVYKYKVGSRKKIITRIPEITLPAVHDGTKIKIWTSHDSGESWSPKCTLRVNSDSELSLLRRS